MNSLCMHVSVRRYGEIDLFLSRVSKLRPAKPFHSARAGILSIRKKYIVAKTLLLWWNVTHLETITLRKMTGPRIVVECLMLPSDKKCLEAPANGKPFPQESLESIRFVQKITKSVSQ